MSKAIFLDRDGTINIDKGYVHRVEDLEFEVNAIDGLRVLATLPYRLVIVTGQSGIGRGYYSQEDYHRFMEEFYNRLSREEIDFDAEYFCPHHPTEGVGKYRIDCVCRKPKTGMLEQAVRDLHIDLSKSWVIGDKTNDIEMGRRAGCNTILLQTGKTGKDGHYNVNPTYTATDLLDAAIYIANPKKA